MAGFCTQCGRPLPENGVCSCNAQPVAPQQPMYQQPTPQQPVPQQPMAQQQAPQYQPPYVPYPQQPYPQYPQYRMAPVNRGPSVFSRFFKTVLDYLKDPVGTSRNVMDRRDVVSGSLAAALCAILILLGSMLYIIARDFDFGSRVPAWIIMSIFAPAVAIGATFGVLFVLTKIAKLPVDPMGLLAATCINSLLAAVLLAASMLLSMIGPFVFELFAILMFAAWAVTTFTMIFQVLNIKMNIISIALLTVSMAVAYIIVIMILNWFLFDGTPLLYITDSTPSFDYLYSLF